MDTSTPPGISITEKDSSAVLQVVTWILLATATLMLGFRLLTRLVLKTSRSFGKEEVFIATSFLFGVGQSVTVLRPQSHVLGKGWNGLTEPEQVAGLKALFAGEILFVLSVCFSKLSVLASLLALTLEKSHKIAIYILTASTVIWTCSSVLALGLRCGTRFSWRNCEANGMNELSILQYEAIGNLITDLLLVILPTWIICPLKMNIGTRARILSFFSTRLLVVVAIIVQLALLPERVGNTSPRRALPYFVIVEVVQFGSITTACVTYFWPFLRSLRSGLFWQGNTVVATQYVLTNLAKPQFESTAGSGRTESTARV